MAVQIPPLSTPLPTTTGMTESQFNTSMNTLISELAPFGTAANALAVEVESNAAAAGSAANSAAASASAATTQAGIATTQAAAASASAQTAINAPGTSATSTTSLTIGAGSKALTIQTGKLFSVGQFVVIARTSAPTNYMSGQITAHNSGTGELTVDVLSIGGSGTYTDWTVALVGKTGVAGASGQVGAGNTAISRYLFGGF